MQLGQGCKLVLEANGCHQVGKLGEFGMRLEANVQKDAQHGQTLVFGGGLWKRREFARIPVDQVQLERKKIERERANQLDN